jgi:selenide, water dikinase
VGPSALAQVLRPLTTAFLAADFPNLLVGLHVADDAAVYRLNDEQAIVQTLDFFAPVLDDPYLFGAVAAANAMSDVYAMGGDVLFALNIAAFPETLAPDVVAEIFRGGADKVREAGGVIAGGHSIYDPEPKYGLAVTGVVNPSRILTKGGARPGDRLYITKRLGTGVLSSSIKSGRIQERDLHQAIDSMLTLNRDAALAAREAGVSALTDITGFGLLGHADEIGRQSNVALTIDAASVPALDGALEAIRAGIRTGGSNRNEEFVGERVTLEAGVDPLLVELMYDPQTSGGLLASVSVERAVVFEQTCKRLGVDFWVIGTVAEGNGITIAARATG